MHVKWTDKLGIRKAIANSVNREIDFGFNWCFYEDHEVQFQKDNESTIFRQLRYFYDRDPKGLMYVKAAYAHFLLDFFMETILDIREVDLVFDKFLEDMIVEIADIQGNKISFRRELDELFNLLRTNRQELYEDISRQRSLVC